MAKNWQHEPHLDRDGHPTGAICVGDSNSSFVRQVILTNPTERSHHQHSYVLWFGAYGWTRLHTYADSLDDALESCAAWLAEYAPGLIRRLSDYHDLMKDACEEIGIPWPSTQDDTTRDEQYWQAEERAMVDHTRTESGWIPSWEWGVALEAPTTEQLYRYVKGE